MVRTLDQASFTPVRWPAAAVPRLIDRTGPKASKRFLEFFAATIRNRNTRAAYIQAVGQFFAWCDQRKFSSLEQIEPLVVAAYIERHRGSRPTVKQHLAAIRRLFSWLVTGGILPHNPAASVRGPKHNVRRGNMQSFVSSDRNHCVLGERRSDRSRTANCGARIAPDHQAL